MSLVIATYVPEGIVMASDSRQSVNAEGEKPNGEKFNIQTINSDAVTKTFLLEEQRVGISNFGQDLLGGVPMAGHIKKFTEEELEDSDDVSVVADKLLKFFMKNFPEADTGFHIAGYKKEKKTSVPHVYHGHVARKQLARKNFKEDQEKILYGATWSGQSDVLMGIMQPSIIQKAGGEQKTVNKPPILWDAMSLQDGIDFSIYAIRTTIDTMRFQARSKNVGGPIDVLVLTPDEEQWIQRKELRGEK